MKGSLRRVKSIDDWRCWALSHMHGAERLQQNYRKDTRTLQSLFIGEGTSNLKLSFMQHYVCGSIMLREVTTPTVNALTERFLNIIEYYSTRRHTADHYRCGVATYRSRTSFSTSQ